MGQETSSRTTSETRSPWGPAEGALQSGLGQLARTYQQSLGLQSPVKPAPTREQFTTIMPGQKISWQDYYRQIGSPTDPRLKQAAIDQWNRGGQGVISAGKSVFNENAYNQAMRDWQAVQNAPKSAYEQLAPAGAQQLLSTIRGENLLNSPYIDEIIRRTTADVNSQFSGAGRYGSGAYQDALARAAGGLRYANFGTERGYQMNASQFAPQYSMYPYDLYNAQLESVYDPLAMYTDLATRYGSVGGQGTATEPLYRNRTAGALGGAASGAATGGMIGGVPGAVIGGIGGLSLGGI